jgi:Zn finger protein HypA/HybF involved in hydrogenase expression
MRKCPKCSEQFDDAERICRHCGRFLEEVPDEVVPATEFVETVDNPVLVDEIAGTAEVIEDQKSPEKNQQWTCSGCGALVSWNFELCPSCGTNREKTPDPVVILETPVLLEPESGSQRTARTSEQRPKLTCTKCGSQRIIPRASVKLEINRDAYVVVHGNPDALVFKEPVTRDLVARICGECGHIDLRVDSPDELYQTYRRSKG